ncbi:hypothetical protein H8D29_07480 [PVC group bacterium]|nr:hypothetical protein [PVC group bacterium]
MSTKKEPCNKSLASKAIVLGGIGTLVSFLALVASAIYFYSAEQGDKREILESRQSYAYDGSCYECGGSVHFHFEGDLENGFMVTDSSHRILSTCWVFIIPVDPESFPALKTEPGAYQCQKCNSAINVIKDGEFYKFTCKHKYGCSLSDYHFDQEDLE